MVTTNAPIITLRDVRFTYDGGATWALDGVSLDIRRGERICLTGPNGSGKSTLSRVIAGLVAPDEGYVVLSGNVVFDESGAHADEYRTARCGIGAVFQHPEDQIVTTVTEDDVAFGPENLAIEHDEIGLRISGSLDAVDMSDYRASDPTRMSGGQQQRIAIAGMLAMDSDVLVLDEPTAMLDPQGRADIMRKVMPAGPVFQAGTLSGNPVKLEQWAMPTEDKAVMGYYDSILPKFKEPKRLSDIIGEVTKPESCYVGAFFPGGHAALVGDRKSVV